MLFFFFFFFFWPILLFCSAPPADHYSFYSGLLFSTIYIMKEYFLSCTALKMYSFLADHQKDAFVFKKTRHVVDLAIMHYYFDFH